jgi:hypothetical protein
MKNLFFNEIYPKLEALKFDLYLSTKSLYHEERDILHDIFICNEGKYKGQVIDIFYNIKTDEVVKIEKYNQ